MAKRKTIDVELRLPVATRQALQNIADQGLLGDSIDDVVAHALRQYLFEQHMRAVVAAGTKG